jgi:hypothetical protein
MTAATALNLQDVLAVENLVEILLDLTPEETQELAQHQPLSGETVLDEVCCAPSERCHSKPHSSIGVGWVAITLAMAYTLFVVVR